MEGDCLSCMKYLMFVFNFFVFVSASWLSPALSLGSLASDDKASLLSEMATGC